MLPTKLTWQTLPGNVNFEIERIIGRCVQVFELCENNNLFTYCAYSILKKIYIKIHVRNYQYVEIL